MSGNGPSSGDTYGDSNINCTTISFNTDVNSPQEESLIGLNVSDKLDVILENNTVIVVRLDTGGTVGSINWSNISSLIECLREGNEYVATVRDIQDGLIKIQVSSK